MKRRLFLRMLLFCVLCILAFCGAITVNAAEVDAELPYVIEEGATYHESAWGFGSGRYGTVTDGNPYTTIPCYAAINGYAFLDEHGYILCFDYNPSTDDILIPPAPDGAVALFLHFHTDSYRNGWVNSEKVSPRETTKPPVTEEERSEDVPTEQEPEDIIVDISQDIQKNKSTAIVVDFSGSMLDNQREVVDLLGTLDIGDDTTIIVFATDFEIVTQEQLAKEDFNVGATTHMVQALNEATSLGVEHLIIISDLNTYGDVALEKSDTLKSVTIYDPDDGYDDYIVDDLLKPTWSNAVISRVKIAVSEDED